VDAWRNESPPLVVIGGKIGMVVRGMTRGIGSKAKMDFVAHKGREQWGGGSHYAGRLEHPAKGAEGGPRRSEKAAPAGGCHC
jgi:hypothetical protein